MGAAMATPLIPNYLLLDYFLTTPLPKGKWILPSHKDALQKQCLY
jgi:hypothetical protein